MNSDYIVSAVLWSTSSSRVVDRFQELKSYTSLNRHFVGHSEGTSVSNMVAVIKAFITCLFLVDYFNFGVVFE